MPSDLQTLQRAASQLQTAVLDIQNRLGVSGSAMAVQMLRAGAAGAFVDGITREGFLKLCGDAFDQAKRASEMVQR